MKLIKKIWRGLSKYGKGLVVLSVVLGLLLAYVYCMTISITEEERVRRYYNSNIEEAEKVPWATFVQMMNDGQIDTVYYHTGREYMLVTVFNDESSDAEDYEYSIEDCRKVLYPAGDNFRERMLDYGVNLVLVKNDDSNSVLGQMVITTLLPFVIMLIFLGRFMNRIKPTEDLSSADVIQTSNVKLSDVIGHEEILEDINLVISLIKDPSIGQSIGCSVPHGILLSGPAGAGKTMIAKAISHEAGVPFLSANGSDFQEVYVGNGARRVRQLFKIAREKAPCILFIDEFDAIGVSRESSKSIGEDVKTINALLKEMDGFKPLDGVFVVAATNYPDKLDPAITRSGRFDREIVISAPKDWKVRRTLFKHYLANKMVLNDIDVDSLAKSVSGFTGADIANVCNEAGLVALARGKRIIDYDCVEEAIGRRVFKGSYSKEETNEEDKKVVAFHEAGHAVMALILGQSISRASIKATTSGVGGAVFHEEKDSQFRTSKDLLNQVKILYAGRVSEEITFDCVTTGASNDIEKATDVLLQYIGTYGFSEEFGMLNYHVLTNCEIDVDIMPALISVQRTLHEEVRTTLRDNYEMVERLANGLMEVGAMSGEEISAFMKKDE